MIKNNCDVIFLTRLDSLCSDSKRKVRAISTFKNYCQETDDSLKREIDLYLHIAIRPLKKVKRKGYDLERILIIDDSPHKSKLNYGNAIYPKPYKGETEDNELIKLINYLESIKDEPNFRKIEKRNWRKKYDQ